MAYHPLGGAEVRRGSGEVRLGWPRPIQLEQLPDPLGGREDLRGETSSDLLMPRTGAGQQIRASGNTRCRVPQRPCGGESSSFRRMGADHQAGPVRLGSVVPTAVTPAVDDGRT